MPANPLDPPFITQTQDSQPYKDRRLHENTQPEETQFEELQPEQTRFEELRLEQTQPKDPQPENTQPEDTQPHETPDDEETQVEETQDEDFNPYSIQPWTKSDYNNPREGHFHTQIDLMKIPDEWLMYIDNDGYWLPRTFSRVCKKGVTCVRIGCDYSFLTMKEMVLHATDSRHKDISPQTY